MLLDRAAWGGEKRQGDQLVLQEFGWEMMAAGVLMAEGKQGGSRTCSRGRVDGGLVRS